MDIESLFDCGGDEGTYWKVTNEDICDSLSWTDPQEVLLSLLEKWPVVERYSVIDALRQKIAVNPLWEGNIPTEGEQWEKSLFYLKNVALKGLDKSSLTRWMDFLSEKNQSEVENWDDFFIAFGSRLYEELKRLDVDPGELFEEPQVRAESYLWRKYYALTEEEFAETETVNVSPEEKERDDLTARAEKGDPQAQYDLAIAYMEGKYLLKVDSSKGWDWAVKAAKQGHKDASEMVLGKQRDDLIARAEKGDPQAQYDLAMAYMEGKYLLKVDDTKGFDWMFKAYRQGHEEATKFTLTVLAREANRGSTECIEYLNGINDLEEIRFLRSLSYYVPLKVLSWGSDSSITDAIKRLDLVDVSGGWSFSIGLLKDGSLVAWGSDNNIKSKIPKGSDYMAISAGNNHGLALKKDGSIVAWGSDFDGQLSTPRGNNFVAVSVGGFHSIALKKDGSVVGWGGNDKGQATTPMGKDFVAISAGMSHSLALKKDGSIVAWGSNVNGQCSVPKGNDFVAVSAGENHSLALKRDGSLVAWGNNSYGQVSVPKGNDFVAISAGGNYSLALRVDGSVETWGSNLWGQLAVPHGASFVTISAGRYHALGLVKE